MKEVTVLIPDDVDAERIYYLPNNRTEYVRAFIVPDRVGSGKDSVEEVSALTMKMSAEEIERFEKALKNAPIMPIPQECPMPSFVTRKEFEALRSRVEKLETVRKEAEAEAFLADGFRPTAEEALKAVGLSDKCIKELRSRVEKLEQESKRQCARVIKMEEGISDDLK